MLKLENIQSIQLYTIIAAIDSEELPLSQNML